MRNLAWLLLCPLGVACTGNTVGPPLTGGTDGTGGAAVSSGPTGTAGGPGGSGSTVSTGASAGSTGGSAGSTGGAGGAGGNAGCARCENGCYQNLCKAALIREGGALDEIAAPAAALDGDRLFFAVHSDGVTETLEVKSIPVSGGQEAVVYDATECRGCTPLSISVDEVNVYFFANQITTKLLAVPKQGGPATPVTTVTAGWPLALTHDATSLYWTDGNQIFSCPKSGGQAKPITNYVGYVKGIVFFDRALVWARKNPGQVERLDLSTGTPTLGNVGNSSNDLCDVAIDTGGVYWWSECAFPYTVWTKTPSGPQVVAKAGTTFQPLGTRDEYGSVATDADSVYFLEYQLVDRIKKGGSSAEPVAWTSEMPADPSAVFAERIVGTDDRFVYLLATGTARLYRVPK